MIKEEVKNTTTVFEHLLEPPVVSVTSESCSHNSRPFVDVDKTTQKTY